MNESSRRWLNIQEASQYFGIPAKSLYSLVARGRLPAGAVLRIGRAIRISAQIIEGTAGKTKR
jgi:excisionase family DNA binding protein